MVFTDKEDWGRCTFGWKIRSFILDLLSRKCLLDILVERSKKQLNRWVLFPGVRSVLQVKGSIIPHFSINRRGSSWPRDWIHVSCIGRRLLYHWRHLRSQVKVLVTQSCLTLCNPMDYSPPGFSVHGILQARILEWVAFPSPGIEPMSLTLQADSLLSEPPGKPSRRSTTVKMPFKR